MCLSAALVGVIVFLKKESLLGEALSHAAYPGVLLGITAAGLLGFSDEQEGMLMALIMCGAFFSCWAGLKSIYLLQRTLRWRSDSALCFILSIFFGVGLTIASLVQSTYTPLYRQAQLYLYGQAATMTDLHILIFGLLSFAVMGALLLFYKEIHAIAFDAPYATSLGIKTRAIELLTSWLIILALIIGIRSVGVVLMSAMLIAPAVAARQYTNKLSKMFLLAALFGVASGFAGNYLSVELSETLRAQGVRLVRLAFPTGPMIVLVASALCLFSLLFAPQRGLLLRMLRIARFRQRCMCENLLKAIWRFDKPEISFYEIAKTQSNFRWHLRLILACLTAQKLLQRTPVGCQRGYQLTPLGRHQAAHIIRLHRLWEVYLVDYLGVGAERVHRNAEEMEHILTPELERELTIVLKDPKQDPHHQPIPSKEEA